jgi:NADPH:quinone reductase-like Zn-dependent oxidoreductase
MISAMRALVATRYGGNDVLELTEVPDPKVGPDSVLVRTRAVGVNPVDWKIVRGYLDGAFPTHFPLIPGWDVAGVVEAAGPAVTELAPGDEVLAYDREDHVQLGTLAELVAVPLRCVAAKPAGLSWVDAAALPLAGLTAYQSVHEGVGVKAGDTVLVHAAAGGVGSFAVQLAVRAGARVIGTASPANHPHVRSLGAEPVAYGDALVDRVRDLAPDGVDAVLDFVGGPAMDVTPDLLATGGRVASVADPRVLEMGGRYVFVRADSAQLAELARLAAAGELRVPIRETFGFEQAVDALARVEEGHGAGKVVVDFGRQ